MTAEEYYLDVSARLRKARADLHKFCDNNETDKAADMIRLIQTLVPEEIDAYNRWMQTPSY